MRGQDAQGDDALTGDEQALIDAARDADPAPDGQEGAPQEDVPAVEPDAAAAPDGQPQPAPPKMVPHQALHEERRARQEAEARVAEERKRSQTLEERMNLLLQNMAQVQAPQPAATGQQPPEIPELDKDPVGHLLGQLQRRDHILNAVVQAVAGQNQQSEQTQAVNALSARAMAAEREFAAQTPDYSAAYEHLIDSRRRELTAAGWTDPAEITAFMSNEAMQLAANALRRNMNPAAVVYELAKVRGYQAAATNDSGPASPAIPQPNPSATSQIAAIAAGQQQARGINQIPGQATTLPSAAAIANMSDDEFSAWAAKATEKERRRVGL